MLIEKIDEALGKREEKGGSPLRLSNSGICARKLAYQLHGFPGEAPNARRQRTFDFGHATEECARTWAREAGVVIKRAQEEVSLYCDLGLEIPGHLDGVVELDGKDWLIEVKSINTDGFQRTQREGPDVSYLAQSQAYMEAAHLDRGIFYFVDKNDQDHLEFPVYRDEAQVEKVKERFRKVAHSTPERLPDREHDVVAETEWKRGKAPAGTPANLVFKSGWKKPTGRKVLGFPCTYCGYKSHCWDVKEPDEFQSGRPIWVLQETALGGFLK